MDRVTDKGIETVIANGGETNPEWVVAALKELQELRREKAKLEDELRLLRGLDGMRDR